MVLTAANPARTGCTQGPAGYVCDFTVTLRFRDALPDSVVQGSVTANGVVPGAPPQVNTETFAYKVGPGTGSYSDRISVFFTYNPCAESSTAKAATQQPNQVESLTVAFGRICTPPPFTVTQVSLTAADPNSAGCSQNPAGFVCSFAVMVQYRDPQPNSEIDGSVTGTLSPPGFPSESKTETFRVPVDPGTTSATVTVSLLFTNSACVEDSAATATTRQPNTVESASVPFGRVCTPP